MSLARCCTNLILGQPKASWLDFSSLQVSPRSALCSEGLLVHYVSLRSEQQTDWAERTLTQTQTQTQTHWLTEYFINSLQKSTKNTPLRVLSEPLGYYTYWQTAPNSEVMTHRGDRSDPAPSDWRPFRPRPRVIMIKHVPNPYGSLGFPGNSGIGGPVKSSGVDA